jgi:hypothetical protein
MSTTLIPCCVNYVPGQALEAVLMGKGLLAAGSTLPEAYPDVSKQPDHAMRVILMMPQALTVWAICSPLLAV